MSVVNVLANLLQVELAASTNSAQANQAVQKESKKDSNLFPGRDD
ncbi:hypothetical protein [Mesorhizobium sp. M7A.F.Ca.US.008.03.1.1]|nr:hypothetical protein [Mesorhizobium sp. M7A.F.Ca.US.008.03.1.1]